MRALRVGLFLIFRWPFSLAAQTEAPSLKLRGRKEAAGILSDLVSGKPQKPPSSVPSKAAIQSAIAAEKSQEAGTVRAETKDGLPLPNFTAEEIQALLGNFTEETPPPSVNLTEKQRENLHTLVLQNLQKRLDYNNDGKMSLSEMVRYAQQKHLQNKQEDAQGVLERMDIDRDGKLSLKEFSDAWDLLLGFDFKALLNSSDPNVTNETQLAMAELNRTKELERKKFEAADKDKDGLLNETEITPMIFPETDPDTMEVHIADLIDQHDKNGNGKIDLHEYKAHIGDHFKEAHEETKKDFHALDLDKSGHLDSDELKEHVDGTYSWKKLLSKVLHMLDDDKDDHVTIDELRKANAVKIDSLPPELAELAQHLEF